MYLSQAPDSMYWISYNWITLILFLIIHLWLRLGEPSNPLRLSHRPVPVALNIIRTDMFTNYYEFLLLIPTLNSFSEYFFSHTRVCYLKYNQNLDHSEILLRKIIPSWIVLNSPSEFLFWMLIKKPPLEDDSILNYVEFLL